MARGIRPGVVEDAFDVLLDEGLDGGHHTLEAIAAGSADELQAQVIGAVRGEFGQVRVDAPADEAEGGRVHREGGEERHALADLLVGDVRAAAALTTEQAFVLQVAHGAGDGRPRRGEPLGEFCLGRESIARLEASRGDVTQQGFEHLPMAGLGGLSPPQHPSRLRPPLESAAVASSATVTECGVEPDTFARQSRVDRRRPSRL